MKTFESNANDRGFYVVLAICVAAIVLNVLLTVHGLSPFAMIGN